jgi:MFS family permease
MANPPAPENQPQSAVVLDVDGAVVPHAGGIEFDSDGTALVDAEGKSMFDADGRPIRRLATSQLIRMSAYWFGISTIWAGVINIMNGRLQFTHLVPKGGEGLGAFQIALLGTVFAVGVQPVVGTISDYTITRWGRRKPYIFIGSSLDLIFLWGIANSNAIPAIAAFVALLQFSSNFSQGPFQGYVPDLVPSRQVGVASGMIGLFQALGNIFGYAVAALAVAFSSANPNSFLIGMMTLGAVEFVTMLSVVISVDEGRRFKSRNGRSWFAILRETWAGDLLRERSFMWLVGSRFFVLVGAAFYPGFSTYYLAQSFGLNSDQSGEVQLVLLAVVAVFVAVSVMPASRLSDRIGRKRVIYASCAMGAFGLMVGALSPAIPISIAGAAVFAVSAGSFLAVDWALMSDIVPKASTGRFMGISNVATACAGTFALGIGAAGAMDLVNRWLGYGAGPRAAFVMGALCYVVGAALLVPVVERRRGAEPTEPPEPSEPPEPASATTPIPA